MEEAALTRMVRWCDLFDIEPKSSLRARFWNVSLESKSVVSERRVIKQDVLRTRADELYFADKRIRKLLEQCLLCFCGFYKLEYMQGLNEIIAPLLAINIVAIPGHYELINDPSNAVMRSESIDSNGSAPGQLSRANSLDTGDGEVVPENLNELLAQYNMSFVFFERIVTTLNPVIFSEHGISALQAQLASFHNLLFFVDAELAIYLFREGMRSDVYAQAWFITLFLRRTPVELALYVLDHLIPHQACPCFLIILAVAFLVRQRRRLLYEVAKDELPTLLVRLTFSSEQEVQEAASLAEALMTTIPPSIIRAMNAIGFDPSLPVSAREEELQNFFRRPSVVLAVEDVVRAPRGVPAQDIPHVSCSGVDTGSEMGQGLADTLSGGEGDGGEDEDEDDSESRAGPINLLPLGKAVRAREPPSLSKSTKDISDSIHAGVVSLAAGANSSLGRLASATVHASQTFMGAGGGTSTGTGTGTGQGVGVGRAGAGADPRSPLHAGYLLLDCRDPLTLLRERHGGGRQEHGDHAPPLRSHIAADVDIESAVQIPPELIAEMCKLAQHYQRSGSDKTNFRVGTHTSWPLVVKLFELLARCMELGVHIVLFDDGLTSACLAGAETRDAVRGRGASADVTPKSQSEPEPESEAGSGATASETFTNLHLQVRSSLAKLLRATGSRGEEGLGLRGLGEVSPFSLAVPASSSSSPLMVPRTPTKGNLSPSPARQRAVSAPQSGVSTPTRLQKTQPATTSSGRGNAAPLATALLVLGFSRVVVMGGKGGLLGDWQAQGDEETEVEADAEERSDGAEEDARLRERYLPPALLQQVKAQIEPQPLSSSPLPSQLPLSSTLSSPGSGAHHVAGTGTEEEASGVHSGGDRDRDRDRDKDGVYALLHALMRTDSRVERSTGVSPAFKRMVDRETEPYDGPDPFRVRIAFDLRGVPVPVTSEAHAQAEGQGKTQQEAHWRANRLSRRYLLRTPEFEPVHALLGPPLHAFLRSVGEAVTIESLKIRGTIPEHMLRRREREREGKGSDGEDGEGASPGGGVSATLSQWGLGRRAGEGWSGLLTATSSAVKAVVEKVPWAGTEEEEEEEAGADGAQAGQDGELATPIKALFSTPAARGEGPVLTPGVGLLGTPTGARAREGESPIKTLDTSLNPNDAARLRHYLVLDKEKRGGDGSITKYTRDLRRLCTDLMEVRGSLGGMATNYEGLRGANPVGRHMEKAHAEM
jgi:hypothetical protein